MKLSQEECSVLGSDSFNNIIIKYSLTEYPITQWSRLFNRITSLVDIKSIINSKSIIVTADANSIYNFDIAHLIREKIEKTESELNSDSLKNQIIINNFIPGLIVVHDNMKYNNQTPTDENPEGRSEYELYLIKIIERIQQHDEYEELLTENLVI